MVRLLLVTFGELSLVLLGVVGLCCAVKDGADFEVDDGESSDGFQLNQVHEHSRRGCGLNRMEIGRWKTLDRLRSLSMPFRDSEIALCCWCYSFCRRVSRENRWSPGILKIDRTLLTRPRPLAHQKTSMQSITETKQPLRECKDEWRERRGHLQS